LRPQRCPGRECSDDGADRRCRQRTDDRCTRHDARRPELRRRTIHPCGIISGCISCHAGTAAPGKPPTHIATGAPCETCHRSTVTFAGARMNHAGIIGACASCHNGVGALGKPSAHIPTNAACESCHKSSVTFAGARMDHSRVTGSCAGCHNGRT